MASALAAVAVGGFVAHSPSAHAATQYAPGSVDNADPTPVMGWSSWSFTRFNGDLSMDEAEANAMVNDGLTSVGYNYLNIDDGWYECPSSSGPLVDAYGRWIPWSNPEVIAGTTYPAPFPGSGSLNGIQVLANYVHSLGLKFGIYETMGISKQAVSAATPILQPGQTGLPGSQATVPGETAASIALSTSQANYNCGGQVQINYTGSGLTGAAATAEEAAAQDYTDSVVAELASWGVDYIKLDGTTGSSGKNAPDIQAWQQAIALAGRPIVLNLTQGSFNTNLEPTLTEYGNQFEQTGDIEISGPSEGSSGFGTASELTQPANAGQLSYNFPYAISCSSAGNCTAASPYIDTSGHIQAMVATETAGTWTQATELTPPANAGGTLAGLAAISCSSAGNCTAAGSYDDSSGNRQAMVATETAGTWAQAIEITPPTGASADPHSPYLYAISCPSAGNCTAVGKYVDGSGNLQAMVATETAGTWAQATELTLPANAGTNPNAFLTGVSCSSAGNCTAVGSYEDSSGNTQAMVASETTGTWAQATELTLPANAGANPTAYANAISCSSAGNCTAVGTYEDSSNNTQAMVAAVTAGTWARATELTLPTGAGTNPGGSLLGVSCSSAENCVAAGNYVDSAGYGQAMVATQTSRATTLFTPTTGALTVSAGATNIPVTATTGFTVGQPLGVGTGASFEQPTVTAVGTQGRNTTLSAASLVGATNIKVASVTGLTAGDKVIIDTGSNQETDTITTVGTSGVSGTGLTLGTALLKAHASGVAVSDPGTGISFSPALSFSHTSGESVQVLSTASTFSTATELTLPGNAGANPNAEVAGISCWSSGSCTTIGSYQDGSGYNQVMVATEIPGSCNTGSGFPLFANAFVGCTSVFPLTSYSHWDNRFAFFGGSSSTGSFEWYGGPGESNDGDSIEVGNGAGTGVSTNSNSGMSQSAEETQLGLWSMGSSPLILGGDLSSSISNGYGTFSSQNSAGLAPFDQSLLMNKEVIAVDQSALDGVQVSVSGSLASSTAAGNQVFAKVLPNGQAYVALFNTSASTSTPTASLSTTVSAINAAIGTFNTNVASKNPVQTYPLPVMPTLAVDSNGYELQDLWGTDSLDTGGSLATGQYAGTISSGTISATVPSEGVALFLVTPLSGASFTAPSITSPAASTFYYGTSGNETITTSGYPTAALTESGALPSGVFFEDNGNGTANLWGTPASGSEGTYDFTITAQNGTLPNATQSYVLTVDQASQSISFTAPSSGVVGVPATLSATGGASGNPVVFSVDPSSGAGVCNVSGTNGTTLNYTAPGSCVIDANQAGNTDYAAAPQVVGSPITVNEVPAITSAASSIFTVGFPKTFTVTTTGSPTPSIAESGALPSGVTFTDNGNGTASLAGTPTAGSAGTYPISITASNGISPAASQSFTLTVLNVRGNPTLGDLSGLVTAASSGSPLANICVYLYPVGGSSATASTCTLANGSYELAGVTPGSYDVAFADPNATGVYTTQWYNGTTGGAATQSGATAVALSGGQAVGGVGAVMSLVPYGNVSGVVTDTSAHDLANICVYLYPVGGSAPTAASCTLANGSYEISGVTPGSYDVAFADTYATGVYVTQWYTGSPGGAATQSGATAVTVAAGGQTLSGIGAEMSLLPYGNVSGVVTDTSANDLANICVYLYPVGGSAPTLATCTLANGSYEFLGLTPGSQYDVAFADTNATGVYVTQWYTGSPGGAATQGGATAVTVPAGGQTLSGIGAEMSLVPYGNVSGAVTDTSSHDLANICVYAYPVGGSASAAASCTLANGSYELAGVTPGSYDVAFADTNATGVYATQWYTGSPGGAATQGGAVAVTVAAGGGTVSGVGAAMSLVPYGNVSGVVTDTSSNDLANICVGLYPVGGPSPVAITCTLANGSYEFYDLTAGTQYDVAFFDPTYVYTTQWYDGAATQSGATAITIPAGGQTLSGIGAAMAG
jgi:hypothetical protein